MDSLYIQAIAGLDYNFSNGIHSILEYYYNGLGKSESKYYNPQDIINMFMGDMSGLAKHYVMAGAMADIERINLTGFVLVNLVDASMMLLPSIGFNVNDNLVAELKTQITVGDKTDSEYGSFFSNIGLKVTGYF